MRLVAFVAAAGLALMQPQARPREASRVQIAATTQKGTYECRADRASTGEEEVFGTVIEAGPNTFAIDECPPTADCSAVKRATFRVVAPGLPEFRSRLVKNGFVRIRVAVRKDGHCRQQIVIESLRQWLGAPNPAGCGDGLILAVSDGFVEPPPDAPYRVERCSPREAPTALSFAAPGREPLIVTPRKQVSWKGPTGEWSVRLISSGECGGTAGWTYWIAGAPLR